MMWIDAMTPNSEGPGQQFVPYYASASIIVMLTIVFSLFKALMLRILILVISLILLVFGPLGHLAAL